MEPISPDPRPEGDLGRIRHGAQVRQSAEKPAMTAALARIETAFGKAAAIDAFKRRVERFLQLGPRHAAVRARFGARAAMLAARNLDAAAAMVEQWWRDERKAFQIASALGCATRLSFDVLSELRLILRLMRSKRMEADYFLIVAALRDDRIAAAAE
jgi:hypothetical protein